MANTNVVEHHFLLLEETFMENSHMNSPERILNLDETGMNIDARSGNGIVCQNIKHHSQSKGSHDHI